MFRQVSGLTKKFDPRPIEYNPRCWRKVPQKTGVPDFGPQTAPSGLIKSVGCHAFFLATLDSSLDMLVKRQSTEKVFQTLPTRLKF